MIQRITAALVPVLTVAFLFIPLSPGAQPKGVDSSALNDLSMEVAALLTLHKFEMTRQQLEVLRKLAPETAPKPADRDPAKANDQCRQVLTDLRAALLEEKRDEDRIGELEEKWEDLRDSDEVDFDDEVDITAAARRRVPDVLRMLSTRQVVAYLSEQEDVLPDPLELLLEALDQVSELSKADWKERCDDIVEEVSWVLGGLDPKASKMVADRVERWLRQVRVSMETGVFPKQRQDFEKSARQFVAQVPPTLVLHNITEHALAELLSNPRLAAALDARLLQK